ncbi:hypothetical protein Pyn_30586 [Prunus yedoensis var. nudiflora]|uniref:Flavodoxin-like domain-containing protein n=1 Tax=Prunus yedoensis var. nudiflora TaxID=2094558 RepID=A0A314YM47_PRUYE|nr:hypothetical protein Pyn_30586 [Prunus yedoensis var. nudiflora]
MSSNSDLVRMLESALGVSFGGSVTDSMVVIATTSVALILGVLVLVWRRSSDRSREVKQLAVPKPLVVKDEEDEFEVASGKTRVTIFYGTQTGTAEGFAKEVEGRLDFKRNVRIGRAD